MLAPSRRTLVITVIGVVVIGIPMVLFLCKMAAERSRVDECQSLVEEYLRDGRVPELTAKHGRFLRIEGKGHDDPPFMSPIGNCLIAPRVVHFEKSQVRMRIVAPGLSEMLVDKTPHFQIYPTDITVSFDSRTKP